MYSFGDTLIHFIKPWASDMAAFEREYAIDPVTGVALRKEMTLPQTSVQLEVVARKIFNDLDSRLSELIGGLGPISDLSAAEMMMNQFEFVQRLFALGCCVAEKADDAQWADSSMLYRGIVQRFWALGRHLISGPYQGRIDRVDRQIDLLIEQFKQKAIPLERLAEDPYAVIVSINDNCSLPENKIGLISRLQCV